MAAPWRTFGLMLLCLLPVKSYAGTLPPSGDCPILKPFAPVADITGSGSKQLYRYDMKGAKIERMQITATTPDGKPAVLHVIWHATDKIWDDKSGDVTLPSGVARCFSGGIFPAHTPADKVAVSVAKGVTLTLGFSDKVWDMMGECPADALCPKLIAAMDACHAAPNAQDCAPFFDQFRELAAPHHCRRAFDTGPVPALWLCKRHAGDQNDILAEALPLARSLPFPEGTAFYNSPAFASVLDGAYAEDYHGGQGQ